MWRILIVLVLLASPVWAQTVGPQPIGGADISGSVSTATGGTTARTQAARAADIMNVLDWGAKCDGTTDDTPRLQAAITAAASKGRVYVPNTGANCMMKQLTVPSNSHITVDGTLKLVNGANASGTAYVFSIGTGINNVLLDGTGTLDGNVAGQTAPNPNYSAGVVSNGSSNVTVRDLTITNVKNWPLNIANTTHCLLDNLKLINGGNSPQFGSGSNDCWARHLYITGINDETFAFYGGVFNSGISESTLTTGAADGISVLNDSGSSAASHHLVIIGNFVTNMAAAGVSVNVGVGGVGFSNEITISNNNLYANGTVGGGKGGVYIANAQKILIANNRISKDLGANAGQVIGIWLTSANQIDILGNTILDEGQTAGAIGTAIHLDSTDVIVRVENNTFWDTQTTHTMTFGINGIAANNLVVLDNAMAGIATPYPSTFPSDTVFRPIAPLSTIISSGASATVAPNISKVILASGTSATFALTMPALPLDNGVLALQCDIAITLTVTANTGQTLIGAPAACSATQGHQFRYRVADTSWRMDY